MLSSTIDHRLEEYLVMSWQPSDFFSLDFETAANKNAFCILIFGTVRQHSYKCNTQRRILVANPGSRNLHGHTQKLVYLVPESEVRSCTHGCATPSQYYSILQWCMKCMLTTTANLQYRYRDWLSIQIDHTFATRTCTYMYIQCVAITFQITYSTQYKTSITVQKC